MVMTFSGFSPTAVQFFDGLADDNSKAYWQANRPTYDIAVKGAMEELLDELGEFGPFKIFRPYNDVRFAKGRPPYKEQIGAAAETDGGAVHYVQLSAAGLMVGAGCYTLASDQLTRFRAAVDDDTQGTEVADICATLDRAGYGLSAMQSLKTAPRGVPKDHPRIEILRRKGLIAVREWDIGPWLHTRKAVSKVRTAWTDCAPLVAWLEANVGPSTLPPDDWSR
ncbi:DUF2461 domain-containing protein [soil metagenome]